MIWIASYPRSGNTFFRNILYSVYGIESSAYYQQESGMLVNPNYGNFKFCKTHHLPFDVPLDTNSKVIYIVRDGRDVMVSSAHHKANIVEPGSDYLNNLLGVTKTRGLMGFGGWSDNVSMWIEKADVLIRFENLIQNPIKEFEKLRPLVDLPQPNFDKIPTFNSQKSGDCKYKGDDFKNFFRRGIAGSWKDEMPLAIQKVFWETHIEAMASLGYT